MKNTYKNGFKVVVIVGGVKCSSHELTEATKEEIAEYLGCEVGGVIEALKEYSLKNGKVLELP